MATDSASLSFRPGVPIEPVRRELREDVVRIVEYTPFPRTAAHQRPRFGFTRDVSSVGLCIGVDLAEPVGSLLRVLLRDVDGSTLRDAIARVVWCSRERDGRYWLGLDLLTEKQPQRDARLPC